MTDSVAPYYPGFEPPLDWLRGHLLFHDKIARIVPSDPEALDSVDFKRFREAFPDLIIDEPSTDEVLDLV